MIPLENGIERSDARTLGALLRRVACEVGPGWGPRDLAPLFRHFLGTPADDELAEWNSHAVWEFRRLARACTPPIVTFGDLLLAPAPPLELLALTKQFAKAAMAREGALPRQLAAGLYLTCIAAAWARHHTRITSHTDRDLAAAWGRLLGCNWLEARLATLVRAALDSLVPPPPA